MPVYTIRKNIWVLFVFLRDDSYRKMCEFNPDADIQYRISTSLNYLHKSWTNIPLALPLPILSAKFYRIKYLTPKVEQGTRGKETRRCSVENKKHPCLHSLFASDMGGSLVILQRCCVTGFSGWSFGSVSQSHTRTSLTDSLLIQWSASSPNNTPMASGRGVSPQSFLSATWTTILAVLRQIKFHPVLGNHREVCSEMLF